MKMWSKWVALCAAALMGAGGVARAEDGVTDDTIRIGAYGPVTGPAAFLGLGSRAGMELAVKQINEAGGVNGRKLDVIFEDDGFSPAKALAAVKKLIEQDHVFMIFGLSGSNPTVGTLDYVKDLKVPNYFTVASAPPITHPYNRYLFRGATAESGRYGEVYSEFLTQFLKVRKIAILSGADENAKNEADNTARYLDKWYGVKPLMRAEFRVGDKDFTPQLIQVKSSNPELLLVTGQTPEASIIVRQARELGIRQPIFVGTASVDNALIANDGYAAEGVIGAWPLPLFPDSDDPDMVKFRDAWSQLNPNAPKGRPNLFDVYAYGDSYVIAEALRKAGRDLTRENFVDALEAMKDYRVSGVATPRTFTQHEHIGNNLLRMLIVAGQHWVPLGWEPTRPSELLSEIQK
jgi:branched-chain amino acid transport system substrate-binding protein